MLTLHRPFSAWAGCRSRRPRPSSVCHKCKSTCESNEPTAQEAQRLRRQLQRGHSQHWCELRTHHSVIKLHNNSTCECAFSMRKQVRKTRPHQSHEWPHDTQSRSTHVHTRSVGNTHTHKPHTRTATHSNSTSARNKERHAAASHVWWRRRASTSSSWSVTTIDREMTLGMAPFGQPHCNLVHTLRSSVSSIVLAEVCFE